MASGFFQQRKLCMAAAMSGIHGDGDYFKSNWNSAFLFIRHSYFRAFPIQGILWTLLSILAILIYEEIWEPDISSENPGTFLIAFFLMKGIPSYRKIDAEEFHYFMYFYAAMSFVWLITSCALFKDTFRFKMYSSTVFVLAMWAAETLLLSSVDVVLMSLLSYDLNEFNKRIINVNIPGDYKTNYDSAAWILIAFSARGILIWLWNAMIGLYLMSGVLRSHGEKKPAMNKPFIHAYDENTASTLPWPGHTSMNPLATNNWRANQNMGMPNLGFEQNEGAPHSHLSPTEKPEMSEIYHSDSHVSHQAHQNAYVEDPRDCSGTDGNDVNPELPSTHWNYVRGVEEPRVVVPKIKTAKVGHGRTGSPVRHVPSPRIPPSIPSPDYTPPSSPRSNLRPALKTRSNYL